MPPGRDEEKSARLAEACYDFAEAINVPLAPWQRLVLADWLSVDSQGRWIASQSTLIVPRQNGKSSLLFLVMLFKLIRLGEQRQLYSSHQYNATRIVFTELVRFIESTPALEQFGIVFRRATGAESIELPSGPWIKFLARSENAARGLSRVDTLYYDEAFSLSAEMLEAIGYTQAAHPNPQAFFTSSAGDASSAVLSKFREAGRDGGSATVCFHEWSAAESDDPASEATWLRANPGIGSALTLRRVRNEFESTPVLRSFQRERLGVWIDALAEHAIDFEAWGRCLDDEMSHYPPLGHSGPVSFGLDVDYDRTGTALCCAWRDDQGQERVALLEFNPSSDRPVFDGLGERFARFESPPTLDLYGIAHVPPRNIRLHLRPSKDMRQMYDELRWSKELSLSTEDSPEQPATLRAVSWPEYSSACVGFSEAVRREEIRVLSSEAMNVAARALGMRTLDRDGSVIYERRDRNTPTSPVVAAALALYGLRDMLAGAEETTEELEAVIY